MISKLLDMVGLKLYNLLNNKIFAMMRKSNICDSFREKLAR